MDSDEHTNDWDNLSSLTLQDTGDRHPSFTVIEKISHVIVIIVLFCFTITSF